MRLSCAFLFSFLKALKKEQTRFWARLNSIKKGFRQTGEIDVTDYTEYSHTLV